jgi:hypothetical protein
MARPKQNQVTFAGNRRSETRTARPHPYAGIPKKNLPRHIEESSQYPGQHVVIVTKTNDRDARAGSPVNDYKGMGYTILSDKPEDSGHGDAVVMGIDIDVYLKRQAERMQEDNQALKGLIHGAAEGFDNMPKGIRFEDEGSGLTYGEDIPVVGTDED